MDFSNLFIIRLTYCLNFAFTYFLRRRFFYYLYDCLTCKRYEEIQHVYLCPRYGYHSQIYHLYFLSFLFCIHNQALRSNLLPLAVFLFSIVLPSLSRFSGLALFKIFKNSFTLNLILECIYAFEHLI